MKGGKLFLGTAALGALSFIGIRYTIRGQVRKGMMQKYATDPLIYGSAFMLAAYGTLSKEGKPTRSQAEGAVEILAEQLVPIWALNIPDEYSIEAYVQDRALAAGLRDIDSLLDTKWIIDEGLMRGGEWIASL
jgi:hypothetical protein